MAQEYYTVRVPDVSAAFARFPKTLTPEEVRQALVATGYTVVENAEMVVRGDSLEFRRVTGGTKGF